MSRLVAALVVAPIWPRTALFWASLRLWVDPPDSRCSRKCDRPRAHVLLFIDRPGLDPHLGRDDRRGVVLLGQDDQAIG